MTCDQSVERAGRNIYLIPLGEIMSKALVSFSFNWVLLFSLLVLYFFVSEYNYGARESEYLGFCNLT